MAIISVLTLTNELGLYLLCNYSNCVLSIPYKEYDESISKEHAASFLLRERTNVYVSSSALKKKQWINCLVNNVVCHVCILFHSKVSETMNVDQCKLLELKSLKWNQNNKLRGNQNYGELCRISRETLQNTQFVWNKLLPRWHMMKLPVSISYHCRTLSNNIIGQCNFGLTSKESDFLHITLGTTRCGPVLGKDVDDILNNILSAFNKSDPVVLKEKKISMLPKDSPNFFAIVLKEKTNILSEIRDLFIDSIHKYIMREYDDVISIITKPYEKFKNLKVLHYKAKRYLSRNKEILSIRTDEYNKQKFHISLTNKDSNISNIFEHDIEIIKSLVQNKTITSEFNDFQFINKMKWI